MTGLSRRDLVRWSLLGAGAAPLATWLAACTDGGGAPTATSPGSALPATTSQAAAASTSTAATVPAATVPAFDPSRPWWMQGNFGPVTEELRTGPLTVHGAIPPELSGRYVRNGSNPASGDSPHWFFGDGMVHGVHLSGGTARAYTNRWVRTTLFEAGAGFGQGAPGGASNQSNVSCIWHGGRLLTSGEVGLPYELRVDDLGTIGPYDFGGRLTSAFTAHPKLDPVTGRLHAFGYGFVDPFLTYHVIDPDGTLAHSETVAVPASVMMHDFSITESDAVFWDLPVTFDLDLAVQYIADPTSGAFPYRWSPEAGARIGVMPLAGGADRIQWFDIDPCYVFHGVNAFRRGDQVVIDVCRLAQMFAPGDLFGGDASLRRWTLDTATGKVTDDVLEDHDPGDLPSRDPRRLGREHRYGYLVSTRTNPHTVELGGLIKHDFTTGTRDTWDPGPSAHSGEWLFVPSDDDDQEDAGYLLAFVHDEASGTSELVVVDATDVTAGPVARIELPQRVPYGFHAAWVPA